MNQPCPFCASTVQEHVFLETDEMLAIYNIAPILPGHSMVVPRKHVETIDSLTDAEMGKFFIFAREVTQLLTRAFDAEGFDWSLQESEAAGQSVAHLHLHIIPRKSGDLNRPGDWYSLLQQNKLAMIDNPGRKRLGMDEIKSVIELINKHKP